MNKLSMKNLTGAKTTPTKDAGGSPNKGADDDYVDEDAEITDSEDEEEEDDLKATGGASTSVGGSNNKGKRMSVFRVKKFMTAQIGKTSAGRATVMKVLGEEGHTVVEAIRSVTTNIRDAKTARANKKDAIRFCLKAYNLWKHKDFTPENTKLMQTDAQLVGEIFCRECTVVSTGKRADVATLSRVAMRLHDGCMNLMTPFIQPKNAARMSELLKFYASTEFFEAMFHNPACREEREALDKSVSTFLLPLAPILTGERERTTLARLQTLLRVLENKRFESVLEHPQVCQIFQQYLDLELGLASKNDLKFILAVRDFEKTASRDLMRMRAPKVVEKYLSPSAEFRVGSVQQATLNEICDAIATGSVGMSIFSTAASETRKNLEDDFLTQFVGSKDYEDLKKRTAQEASVLEKQLMEEGSISATPLHRGGGAGKKSVF